MIKIILVVIFMVFVSEVRSQETRTTELKPIHHQGNRYYYDFMKVDGGAYGLQIPLQSLGDEEVNRRYKSFRTLNTIGSVFILVPLVYLVSLPTNNGSTYVSSKDFWIMFGASLAAQISFQIMAKSQLNKGIDRYNMLIVHPSSHSLGASLTYKF